MSGFVLSSLTLADPPGCARLHSRFFTIYSRLFSVMLFIGAFQLLGNRGAPPAEGGKWTELGGAIAMFLTILAFSRYLWVRPKPVIATKDGLSVGAGKKRRLIPWSRVLDVREMPSVRLSAGGYPRMWQVDLDRDERFDFCGTAKAREIVKGYIERAAARPH
jgi:hypothetical protein